MAVPERERDRLRTEVARLRAELRARSRQQEREQERARAAEARSRFLARITGVLTASLEYESAFQELAQIIVEEMADYCVTYVLEDDTIRRAGLAHADPENEPMVRRLLEFGPPTLDDDAGPGAVIRTAEPILARRISREMIAASAMNPEYLRIVEQLNPLSAMVLPLQARGHTVGAITFATTVRSGRHYTEQDLRVAREVAARAALAIDNARLYGNAVAASRAKSDFLALMSHELRTPLNAIVGFTDLLTAGIAGELTTDQYDHLIRIRASALHLRDLIDEVLTFSRLEAGRERRVSERVDIALLTRETADRVGSVARDKGLRYEIDLPDEPVEIETDPDKVRRILLNLLSNAVAFTERGGVRIDVRRVANAVELRVRDTGIGIAPEHLDHIFEPFWQAERGLTRHVGGTGVGLTVARRLARMLGGDITVESELGRGSTFTVRLPANADSGHAERGA